MLGRRRRSARSTPKGTQAKCPCAFSAVAVLMSRETLDKAARLCKALNNVRFLREKRSVKCPTTSLAPTAFIKKHRCVILGCMLILSAVAAIEYLSAVAFRADGHFGWWDSDVWSSENSQRVAGAYSFSHIIHGMLFYGFLWLVARRIAGRAPSSSLPSSPRRAGSCSRIRRSSSTAIAKPPSHWAMSATAS